MFSSVENWSETWSSTQRIDPLSRSMQSPPDPYLPWRKRRWRTTMSSPEMRNVPSLSPMPSPGAVWPAMVIFELVMRRLDEGTWM